MVRRAEGKSRTNGRKFVGALNVIGLAMAITSLLASLALVFLQAQRHFWSK
jgi:hypothetical protein